MLKLLIFEFSWAAFPVAGLLAWILFRRSGLARWLSAILLAGTCTFLWARFVEPRLLQVHRETITLPGASAGSPAIRIALFSDTHVGMFENTMPVSRIVRRINAENVDAVFLAGDITFYPHPEQITNLLAPLSDLNAPLYAVLGNHDVGFPGPDLSRPIIAAIEADGGKIVHNRAFDENIGGQRIIVAGASDLWQRKQDFGFSSGLPAEVPVLLLTHNPDTAYAVPPGFSYDLMLAGHTHGGQIRIPFLYKRHIPTQGPFDKELHVFPSPSGERLVYVSSGTGMSGLPMRFLMPPRIDVLTVHLPDPE
ncbi:MAG: metallophosphoesterase family protein [Hyphomonas sp.]|nr:metallophosphoesterase family protein [Hyphomonas sp.]